MFNSYVCLPEGNLISRLSWDSPGVNIDEQLKFPRKMRLQFRLLANMAKWLDARHGSYLFFFLTNLGFAADDCFYLKKIWDWLIHRLRNLPGYTRIILYKGTSKIANPRNLSGSTPLICSLLGRSFAASAIFIAAGADVTLRNSAGASGGHCMIHG